MRAERMGRGGRTRSTRSVVTAARFPATPARVWEGLTFFEQIPGRPPLFLRLLLPTPVCVEGGVSEVGDEARCVYEEGHLLKRVTRIERERRCCFVVSEQALPIGGGIRLEGGCFALREVPGGGTRVELETRYSSPRRPAWFWAPVEAAVGHAFHRHILGSIRRGLASAGPAAAAGRGPLRSSAGAEPLQVSPDTVLPSSVRGAHRAHGPEDRTLGSPRTVVATEHPEDP